jgi:imidazolonepropionase-like amidohydrolase
MCAPLEAFRLFSVSIVEPRARLRVLAAALLLALNACSGAPGPPPSPTAPPVPTLRPVPAGALVIANGTVIDGTGAAPIPEGVVVIEDDRITAVGRSVDFAIPDEAAYIDAGGGTILPGIINAHLHSASSAAVRRFYFLLKGVTSVCDMGSTLKQMPAFAGDHVSGPAARGFHSGPMITVHGGYPDIVWHGDLNYEVATPDEARSAVADLVVRGADVIKIALEPGSAASPWPMLDLEAVRAVVQEAHGRGKLVRAHVGDVDGTGVLDNVLLGGVDVVEHIPLPVFSGLEAYNLYKERGHYTLTAQDRERLARLVAGRVVMVPTLSAHVLVCDSPNLTPVQKQGCYDFYLDPVRLFHALGGAVALANDWGASDAIELGMPLREMQLLLAAGLTPMEVIRSGTQRAAWACGHGDELGTLEPDMLADVIIVDGDPLADIEAMSRVVTVIKAGRVALPVP